MQEKYKKSAGCNPNGNKRTARITSNAILIANGYCPLSFRSVDSIDYKKAMLIFYEQNNLYAFKQIFIDQFEFARLSTCGAQETVNGKQ